MKALFKNLKIKKFISVKSDPDPFVDEALFAPKKEIMCLMKNIVKEKK